MAKHTADLCFGSANVPALKPEKGLVFFFVFSLVLSQKLLLTLSSRCLQRPLSVSQDRLTAGCGLG